jgi:hypothetical protein
MLNRFRSQGRNVYRGRYLVLTLDTEDVAARMAAAMNRGMEGS